MKKKDFCKLLKHQGSLVSTFGSAVVSDGRQLLDVRSRWLAFPPVLVITSFGPPTSGYINYHLYGCSLDSCDSSLLTCNKCPHCLGFYTDSILNNLLSSCI